MISLYIYIQGGGTSSGDLKPDDGDTIKSSVESNIEKGSFKTRQKYKDVADAAQAAFESAEYAAAAARAAVELSRMGGPHTPGGSSSRSPFGSKKEEASGIARELSRTRSASSSSSSEEENAAFSEVMSPPPSLQTQIPIPSRYQSGVLSVEPERDSVPPRLNLDKAPFSMRTRQVRGC